MGYSSADVAFLRPNLQNYLACGPEADRIDFFSLNSYLWVRLDSLSFIS